MERRTAAPSRQYLSTAAVSRALGVSVSTVKRWVDEGILPAHKTPGGHRKLLASDVLRLARDGTCPCLDPARLGLPDCDAESSDGNDPSSELVDRAYRAFLAGDEDEIRAVILGTREQGRSIAWIGDNLIRPAMVQIGLDWEAGRIDVMHEHRASQLCIATLHEVRAALQQTAAAGPIAVGGAPEHDRASLPSLLVELTLLERGWRTVNLGPFTPKQSFRAALEELRPKLLWISICHEPNSASFVQDFAELRATAQRMGALVVTGGRALTKELRGQLPSDLTAESLEDLDRFVAPLGDTLQRPRRGRPRRSD